MHLKFVDWGLKAYDEALKEQEEIFNKKVNQKLLTQKDISQDFIVCQHPHVYTLGKHGKASNLLANEQFLQKINATFHHINRGGDITYHGPGQVVGYPSLDLDALGLTLRTYIETVEESVINLMKDYSINCERLKGATGVWIDAHTTKARKICAIGVKASRSSVSKIDASICTASELTNSTDCPSDASASICIGDTFCDLSWDAALLNVSAA